MFRKILEFANVDMEIYNDPKKTRAGDKSWIRIYAITPWVSGTVSAAVIYFFFKFIIGVKIIAIALAGVIGWVVLMNTSTLLHSFSKGRLYGTFFFSFLMMVMGFIGVKPELSKDEVMNDLKHKIRIENSLLDEQMQSDLNTVRSEVQTQVVEINKRMAEANAQWWDTKRSAPTIAAIQKELNAVEIDKEERMAAIRANYATRKKDEEIGKVELVVYYVTNSFNTDNLGQFILTISLMILLLITEASPAIAVLALMNGKYYRKVQRKYNIEDIQEEHVEDIEDKAQFNVWRLEKQIVSSNGLRNIGKIVTERRVWEMLKEEAPKGFKNIEELLGALSTANTVASESSKAQSNGQMTPEEDEFPEPSIV